MNRKHIDEKILKQKRIVRRYIQLVIIAVIFCMGVANIAPENDIYWQLKIGESIWRYHHFPTTDPYNFSNPNAVWTLEEWIVEVIFYLLQTHFGWGALILLKAFILAFTFALVLKLLNTFKTNLYLSLLALFLAVFVNTRGYWTVFPSIFEYLFIVIAVYVMELYRKGKWQFVPYILPLFSLVWANSHASFFLLEGITVSYIIGSIIGRQFQKKYPSYEPIDGILSFSQIKALSISTLVSLAMPLVSPNGMNTFLYPFIISISKFSTSYVNEYISFFHYINFFSESFLVSYALILFFLTSIIMAIGYKKLNIIDVLLFLFFSYLAFRAYRHLAIFSLIALIIFARYVSIYFREYRGIFKRTYIKDTIVVLLLVAFVMWYKIKHVPFGLTIDMSGFPVKAAEIVTKNNILPNMFNHYNYGGFLIWKMDGYKVFIDGRLEMYLGKAGEDYLAILEAKPGWEQLIKKYNINFFLNYAQSPITTVLLHRDDWRLIFFDSQYVVLVKNTKKNKGVIDKYYNEKLVASYRNIYDSQLAKKTSTDYNQEGLEWVKKGDLEKALKSFQKAVSFDPENIIAILNLGKAYEDVRLYKNALEVYKLGLLSSPNNTDLSTRIKLLQLKYNPL